MRAVAQAAAGVALVLALVVIGVFAGPACDYIPNEADYARMCRETCATAGGVKFNNGMKCECHPRQQLDAGFAERGR